MNTNNTRKQLKQANRVIVFKPMRTNRLASINNDVDALLAHLRTLNNREAGQKNEFTNIYNMYCFTNIVSIYYEKD